MQKQDGSGRYQPTGAPESPVWKMLEKYHKGELRTNGELKDKDVRYYRWDDLHKDIEVYDSKGRELGSVDPVTGKDYRPGDMKINKRIEKLID